MTPGPHAAPPLSTGGFHAVPADQALVAKVLAAEHVAVVPTPPAASYPGDLWVALWRKLGDLLDRTARTTHVPAWLLTLVVAVPAAAALALVLRGWWLRRAARAARQGIGGAEAAAGLADGNAADSRQAEALWDALAWRQELERRLARGAIAEALAAAWWWLARSLAGSRAEANWTAGELLRWSRRDDLRGLLGQLDGMTYGPRPPEVDELRRLMASFEAKLA